MPVLSGPEGISRPGDQQPALSPNLPSDAPATLPQSDYDVVVVGGEPEGVAAALAAARNGAETLLVESRDGLGGLFTYGELNYLDTATFQGESVNAGIFEEWHEQVGGRPNFDIEEAKRVFLQMVRAEPKLEVRLNTGVIGPVLSADGTRLQGLIVQDRNGNREMIAGQRFIDATQDADLAAMAGVPHFVGQADIGLDRQMAVTLVLTVEHVDWERIGEAMDSGLYGGGHHKDTFAWGFPELAQAYPPQEPNTRLRGLNIALNQDGSVSINALQILGVDGLDPEQKRDAYRTGVREAYQVVRFLRERVPGFERAVLGKLPPELYVRETRHIHAEYQLKLADVWENRDQWDQIGLGGYPVDIQGISYNEGDVIVGAPSLYAIPFRSLVPKKVDGLLVAGRAAGYTSLAAGSARTVPTGMSAGEAAGLAAVLSLEQHVSFRDMSRDKPLIAELQQRLKNQGARLIKFQLYHPYKGMWYYPGLRTLLSYGLIAAGYTNDFALEETLQEQEFVFLLEQGVQRMAPQADQHRLLKANLAALRQAAGSTPVTRDKAAEFLLLAYGQEPSADVWFQAGEAQLLDQPLLFKLIVDRPLMKYEAFYMAGQWLDRLKATH